MLAGPALPPDCVTLFAMFNANASARPAPERVLRTWDDVCMAEVLQQLKDGTNRVAGYSVYREDGESRVLHPTLEEAETDFLRRTWR